MSNLLQVNDCRRPAELSDTQMVDNSLLEAPDQDQKLELEVIKALKEDPFVKLFPITTHVEDGVVVMSGTLSSYYMSQCAQECVRKVQGVVECKNEIEVVYND